ncbi:MAG: diphthamide biosynthesis enzyme Dph2 [Thermoplasmata archaeon]
MIDATVGSEQRVFPCVGPELMDALRSGNFRKVVVQVPAGLVRNADQLVRRIREETGAVATLLVRACFGACDFPTPDEAPGADAAVVLGHAPIPNVTAPLPSFFVEMREPRGDPVALANVIVGAGLPRRLGLVASVQHLDLVDPLIEELARVGYVVRTKMGDRRLAYAAQALGCNYTGAESLASEVDAFVFLGTGRFHPLGLAYSVDRPVFSLDPLQATLDPPLDRTRLIRDRLLMVARARDAQRFGILVSTFVGQNRSSMAQALQRKLLTHGREGEILQFGRLESGDLIGRAVDAYVNTACPRIALDDWALYPKPMLTPPELLMVLGEVPLEPYRFDTYH